MRFRCAIFVPVCLSLSAWSQLTYTVPVVDQSNPGSPLAISGTASFTEFYTAKSVVSSGTFRIEARNVSGKSIILLAGCFDEAGPHGSGTHHVIQIDHFFWGQIAPGESFALARGPTRRQTSALRQDSVEPAAQPNAEVKIEYVQFADGTNFGDETAAQDALRLRPVIFEALQRLDGAGSAQEFLALLAQKIQPAGADEFLKTFRQTQKTHGTKMARSQVHVGLVVAEGRVPALLAAQTVQK
jgi:hypothetical protein